MGRIKLHNARNGWELMTYEEIILGSTLLVKRQVIVSLILHADKWCLHTTISVSAIYSFNSKCGDVLRVLGCCCGDREGDPRGGSG